MGNHSTVFYSDQIRPFCVVDDSPFVTDTGTNKLYEGKPNLSKWNHVTLYYYKATKRGKKNRVESLACCHKHFLLIKKPKLAASILYVLFSWGQATMSQIFYVYCDWKASFPRLFRVKKKRLVSWIWMECMPRYSCQNFWIKLDSLKKLSSWFIWNS